jgi:hypothetical protein
MDVPSFRLVIDKRFCDDSMPFDYLSWRQIAIHVSHLSRKKHERAGRSGERIPSDPAIRLRVCASRLVVPAPRQDLTSICCLKLRRAVAED